MKYSNSIVCATGLGLALAFGSAMAVEPADGVNRAAKGTVDAVTSPGKIVEGIAEDTATHGPIVGTVTGTTKGTVNAAGQAVTGAANVGVGAAQTGVGIVQKVLEPITGSGQ